MKQTFKILGIAIALLIIAVQSNAQNPTITDYSNVSAFILTPLGFSKDIDMDFGNLSVNATLGTCVLDPDAAGTRHNFGGVSIPTSFPGLPRAAKFTITGAPNATVIIEIPDPVLYITTINNGPNSMTVDTWTDNLGASVVIGGSSSETLYVGATLHVAGNQAPGLYTSGVPFPVTVHYQ